MFFDMLGVECLARACASSSTLLFSGELVGRERESLMMAGELFREPVIEARVWSRGLNLGRGNLVPGEIMICGARRSAASGLRS